MGDPGRAGTRGVGDGPWLHIRREPFEFGLLPMASLMHKEGAIDVLKSLRARLLEASAGQSPADAGTDTEMTDTPRVTSKAIASCLNLPEPQALLVLETLASVLPTDNEDIDPLAQASSGEVDSVGTDVDHLMLFLFAQSYKRAPHRAGIRDPAITADVWPQGPSPFDVASPTAASALQLKTSLAARQRSLPGQVEEEARQLTFVQKNLKSMLSLLADKNEAGEEVISIDKFELLGFFVRVGRVGTPAQLLMQTAPFFANSDPNMPAAPVSVEAAYDWIHPRLCFTSDHGPELPPLSPRAGDSPDMSDVHMADVDTEMATTPTAGSVGMLSSNGPFSASKEKRLWVGAGVTNVDGIAKMSILKGETEIDNGTVRVAHCHDSVIYILAPLKYATVIGCSDSIIVLGPAGKGLRIETCERVQVIAPCARVKISNCRESVFYLGTNTPPVLFGDNKDVKLAPYNTFYPKLDYHLAKSGVSPSLNLWDSPLVLGSSDPHDSSSPRAGTSVPEPTEEGSLILVPDKFVPFVVPFRGPQEQTGSSPLLQQQTRSNPFHLPKPYLTALQQKTKTVENLRQTLKTAVLEESKKKELTNVIQAHFKEWLLSSGNIRQIYDLARLDRDP